MNSEPKLEAPGAGLPRAELIAARLLFKLRLRKSTRETANSEFLKEREAIRTLAVSCDAENGARRVLIPRLRGMEDSSRNWSVWMTLDHLRIVNSGIARTIGALGKGVVPPGAASTAAVKPSPGASAAVVSDYEKSCDAILETVAAIPDLKTTVRFAHPWFGLLDAAGWHVMAGGHLGIHRGQIESILSHQKAGIEVRQT